MTIDIKLLFELILVVLSLKLIVSRWQPPLQESLQAILCIVIGTILGVVANPTKEGFIWGIISSSIAFYGSDLLTSFKSVKNDLKDLNEDR